MARKKKEVDIFEELGLKLWDKFDSLMESKGFRVIAHNDTSMGRCSTTFNEKDAFVPLINLHYWYFEGRIQYDPCFMSIHVDDRNGNRILSGNGVAVYKMDIKATDDPADIEARFDTMVATALENYGCYSKENRLDSAYKELKEDRRKF